MFVAIYMGPTPRLLVSINHWFLLCLQCTHTDDTDYIIIQMCSGITRGRVLSGELYAQRFQKLIYLHLFTDCFMKISPQSSEQILFLRSGITRGRVLTGELNVQRCQKLIYLYLFTDCFMKISPQSLEQVQFLKSLWCYRPLRLHVTGLQWCESV